jgi:ERCC4-related helicase
MEILPCAKLVGVMEQVQDWLHEAPEDKIIIFTQFRHFQTMVGCMLEQKKINFVYFSVSGRIFSRKNLQLIVHRVT